MTIGPTWESTSPAIPSGPVFVSYRESDGQPIARVVARVLRAHGVPVWLDETDLPPGEINRRLEEALASGLSGGIIVITPDVAHSVTIRELEAPRLLQLAADPSFALALVNSVVAPGNNDVDRGAPSRLLGSDSESFSAFKQYHQELVPAQGEGIRALGSWMALNRLRIVRAGREQKPFIIDVQSRAPASSRAADGDLVFRTIPPKSGRLPDREVWEDLRDFLAALPRALAESGTREIHLRGGSHLSVAFALGAALPVTLPYSVSVAATSGSPWTPLESARRSLIDRGLCLALDFVGRLRRGRSLAVFVDLHNHPEDGAFGRYLRAEGRKHRHHQIRRRERFSEITGPLSVAQAAHRIRRVASGQATSRLDLFLRMPWPAAVLLGRELNTLTVTLHEWEKRDGQGFYRPVIIVASGEGPSSIQEVL